MLREEQFRDKKNTKIFNTICTRSTRIIKDIVKSQPISFSGEGDDVCLTSSELHIVSGTPIMNIFNISLQNKALSNIINT